MIQNIVMQYMLQKYQEDVYYDQANWTQYKYSSDYLSSTSNAIFLGYMQPLY